MSKTLKMIMVIITIITCFTLFTNNVFATDYSNPTVFKESGAGGQGLIKNPTDTDGKIKSLTSTILGIIQVVGTVGAVGVLMVLGIKYMMGSVEEKAQYKKSMLPYVIGAILIFSATTITTVVYNMAIGI